MALWTEKLEGMGLVGEGGGGDESRGRVGRARQGGDGHGWGRLIWGWGVHTGHKGWIVRGEDGKESGCWGEGGGGSGWKGWGAISLLQQAALVLNTTEILKLDNPSKLQILIFCFRQDLFHL